MTMCFAYLALGCKHHEAEHGDHSSSHPLQTSGSSDSIMRSAAGGAMHSSSCLSPRLTTTGPDLLHGVDSLFASAPGQLTAEWDELHDSCISEAASFACARPPPWAYGGRLFHAGRNAQPRLYSASRTTEVAAFKSHKFRRAHAQMLRQPSSRHLNSNNLSRPHLAAHHKCCAACRPHDPFCSNAWDASGHPRDAPATLHLDAPPIRKRRRPSAANLAAQAGRRCQRASWRRRHAGAQARRPSRRGAHAGAEQSRLALPAQAGNFVRARLAVPLSRGPTTHLRRRSVCRGSGAASRIGGLRRCGSNGSCSSLRASAAHGAGLSGALQSATFPFSSNGSVFRRPRCAAAKQGTQRCSARSPLIQGLHSPFGPAQVACAADGKHQLSYGWHEVHQDTADSSEVCCAYGPLWYSPFCGVRLCAAFQAAI